MPVDEEPTIEPTNSPTPPSFETDNAILVLNTKPFAAKPLIFDLNGSF